MGPYSSRKGPYKERKRHQSCLSVCAEKRFCEDGTEEPGGLQSCPGGCRRAGHDLATKQQQQ